MFVYICMSGIDEVGEPQYVDAIYTKLDDANAHVEERLAQPDLVKHLKNYPLREGETAYYYVVPHLLLNRRIARA